MTKYKSIIFGLSLLILFGCEETIPLDLKQVDSQVVIEGLVTNEMKNHYIRISKTNDFYAQGANEKVVNATVSVSDSEGNVYSYSHNPEAKEDGLYLSDTPYAGQIGLTYNMSIEFDGQQYSAAEELFPVTEIDTLTYILNEDEFDDPDDEGYFYEVLLSALEPQETEDYYLFKFYRNDSILQDSETDIYFSDDKLLQERIDDIEAPGFLRLGDKGTAEMYSITRKAFIYYNDLFNLLNGDGGFFSPPPVNPRTNLSNGAFGYFQVSSVDRDSITIEE